MYYRFNKLPLHWILVPLFFILHSVNEYYGLLSSKIVFRYLGYYILLAVLLFTGGRWPFKSYKKSAIWTTTLLLVFFFWGAAHDFLKRLGLPSSFTSYSLLLPMLFILLLFLTWRLWKRTHTGKSTVFLNLVFSVLIIVDLAQITYKWLSPVDENDLSRNNPPLQINIKPIPDALKPDIFFIVFDEYASSLSLKKYFNFDNHLLDSMMKSNGFYVVQKAKSNYSATPLSVSSTFNMQYFNYEGHKFDALDLQRAWYTLNQSFIPRFFQSAGYNIKSISIDSTGKIAPTTFDLKGHYKIFEGHTLIGRLYRDIFWNFYPYFPFLKSNDDPIAEHVWGNKRNLDKLLNEMKQINDTPKFVYTHLLIPHPPLCFDHNGEITSFSEEEKVTGKPYTENVLYCNKIIQQILSLKQKINRPFVMIIEGDHGYRENTPIQCTEETKFMNLSTFYFSDQNYNLLNDSISPVNTFRTILNKYFDAGLPLLKDSTISIKYKS